ncbi:MAG: hypothetical protein PHE56_16070, partial [Bacteroidales bacterium]|nr:hypothetical protein [Bacteroidales bacterium]
TGLGVYKGVNLVAWYDALDIGFTGKISGYRDGNFIMRCRAILDNPKDFAMTVTKPTIRIFNGETIIARSEPSKEKVLIKANAITYIDYELKIPALSGDLYKLLLKAGVGIANFITQLINGEANSLSLGIELTAKYYMQFYGIEREWSEKFTI